MEANELVQESSISMIFAMDREAIYFLDILIKRGLTHGGHSTSPGEQYCNGFRNGSGRYIFPRKSSSKEDLHREAIEPVQESYISIVFPGSGSYIFPMEKESLKSRRIIFQWFSQWIGKLLISKEPSSKGKFTH